MYLGFAQMSFNPFTEEVYRALVSTHAYAALLVHGSRELLDIEMIFSELNNSSTLFIITGVGGAVAVIRVTHQ